MSNGRSDVISSEDSRSFLENLKSTNYDFYNDERGKGAIRNIQQTFPYPWIYVAELIQNAIDEKAKTLSFTIIGDNSLVFEHNGKPFEEEDIKGLCTRGISNKSSKTIGFMGVGFKSVFKSFQKVEISSNEWKFYLEVPVKIGIVGDHQRDWLGCVLPIYDKEIVSPSSGMTCKFILSKRVIESSKIESDLENVFQKDMSLLPLLALNGVEELIWGRKTYLLNCSEQNTAGKGCKIIKLESLSEQNSEQRIKTWIMFSKSYKPTDKAIRNFLEHREIRPESEKEEVELKEEISKERKVQVFCELTDQNIPALPTYGKAYSVLPTQTEVPLRINVQADWLLDISRSQFMQFDNNHWHKEIFSQLPILVKSFLEWLVSEEGPSEENWWNGYNILPNFNTNITNGWFNEEIIASFKSELINSNFLPIWGISLKFLSPSIAHYLPDALNRKFDDEERFPWILFGEDIISRKLLGEHAFNSLINLGILNKIQPQEIGRWWKNGAVAKWLSEFKDGDSNEIEDIGLYTSSKDRDIRKRELIGLYASLGDLETNDSDWQYAELNCASLMNCGVGKNVAGQCVYYLCTKTPS